MTIFVPDSKLSAIHGCWFAGFGRDYHDHFKTSCNDSSINKVNMMKTL